jgi:hypothetical protein
VTGLVSVVGARSKRRTRCGEARDSFEPESALLSLIWVMRAGDIDRQHPDRSDAMDYSWYVEKQGVQSGPYSSAQLKALAVSGRLRPDDRVRRADQQKVVAASNIKGLFPEVVTPRRPAASSPPPLPTTDARSSTTASPPPTPQADRSLRDGIVGGLKGLGEASKSAALLAAAQARKAHLENVTLRAAYLDLGRDIYAAGRFRDEFAELYSGIGEAERRIEQIASSRPQGEPSKGLAERATKAAAVVKATAQTKALSMKKDSLLRRLGESACAKHGKRSGTGPLIRSIADGLTRMEELDREIDRLSGVRRGKLVTPRRVLVGAAGLGAVALVLVAIRGKDSGAKGRPPGGGPAVALGDQATGRESAGVTVPDFSKVDYRAVPAGAKREKRSKVIEQADLGEVEEGQDHLIGKWAEEEGYLDAASHFIRQGQRIIWFEEDRRTKFREDHWLDGKLHGSQSEWRKDGSRFMTVTYLNNMIHGEATYWHENGKMSHRLTYLNGKKHGLHTEWYPSGKKKVELASVDGRANGPYRAWYENGQRKDEARQVNGVFVGRRTQWYSNGEVRCEFDYDEGRLRLRRGDAISVYLEMMATLVGTERISGTHLGAI